jgi:hypothetical protein
MPLPTSHVFHRPFWPNIGPQDSPRATSDKLADLEADRPVIVTAWELCRHVRLVTHPAVEHPWEDPRWFQVTADGLVTEVDEPESERGCMYPASVPFAATRTWTDDDGSD